AWFRFPSVWSLSGRQGVNRRSARVPSASVRHRQNPTGDPEARDGSMPRPEIARRPPPTPATPASSTARWTPSRLPALPVQLAKLSTVSTRQGWCRTWPLEAKLPLAPGVGDDHGQHPFVYVLCTSIPAS